MYIRKEANMIYEIKKGNVVPVDNNVTTRKLRVLECVNKELVKERGAEPIYKIEVFDTLYVTRREINAITNRENCLGTYLN